MQLERLKSSKFEALNAEMMKHIVGGRNTETGGGGEGNSKYSNDWMSTNADLTEYHLPNGGDWSDAYLSRAGVERWPQQ